MAAEGRRLPRADRLLQARDFSFATRRGRRAVGQHFVLVAAPTTRSDGRRCPRIGMTVSRRVGGSVVRNRVKRGIREWFRNSRRTLPAGVDLLVIARRSAGGLTSAQVARRLGELVARTQTEGCN